MIDNKLAIAGELTWQEVVESVEGFYEGKADVHPLSSDLDGDLLFYRLYLGLRLFGGGTLVHEFR